MAKLGPPASGGAASGGTAAPLAGTGTPAGGPSASADPTAWGVIRGAITPRGVSRSDISGPIRSGVRDFDVPSPGGITAAGGTVVGAHSRIKGTLEFGGVVRLDGAVEGEITVDGELTVGEQAVVTAQITARSAVILGRVSGDISCADRIELRAGSVVLGDIYAPRVIIEDGVEFEGRCKMNRGPAPDIIE